MYLEVKAVISGIAIIILFFVISQILFVSLFLGFILFIAIFLIVFSDMIIGIKVIKTNAQYWFDPLPQGTHELCVMKTLSGLMDLIPVTKGPHGLRFGVMHKRPIAIINQGDDQFHTRNGNLGFFAHENYDKNINIKECKALELLDGDDIKEIYRKLQEQTKKQGEKKLSIEGFVWNSKKAK